MRGFRFIHLIVFLTWVHITYATPYYFKQYQVQDGLSNNTIRCCVQDTYGYMWFGTRDGLNRFDGYTFKVFRNDSESPNSIGSNTINTLAIDQNGTLWVGTITGLYKYNPESEDFTLIPLCRDLPISSIVQGMANDLWLISGGKILNYNIPLDHIKTYTLPDNSTCSSVCITVLGQIWVAGRNGFLYELIESTGIFSSYDVFAHSTDVMSRHINCIYPTATGDRLLIGTHTHGVKLFDINKGDYTDCFRHDPNQLEITVQDFLQINESTVWVSTELGLYIFNIEKNEHEIIKKRSYDPYSISTNILTSMYKDRENGIWICSYAGGVNYYSPFLLFRKYYTYPGENVMQGDLVHDICTDQYDNIWIATEDAGINKYNPKTKQYINYQPLTNGNGISHSNIHGMVADDDKLWIASIDGAIDVMDIKNGTITKRYHIGKLSKPSEAFAIVNMKKLNNEMLLVATSHGVFKYNSRKEQFEFMPQFPSLRIQSIYKDHKGIIWAGSVNYGLYYYDPVSGENGKFELDTITNPSSNTINDICEDREGNLWFATLEGVKKYNRQNKQTTRYSINKGLPSNISYRIIPDKQGALWITTTNGLVCMAPDTEAITIYQQEHGLISNQFNYNSGWIDKDGTLYFGMVKGMISFNPQDIHRIERKNETCITGLNTFEINNRKHFPVVSSNAIQLSYKQSTLGIDYTAMSFISPQLIKYAYYMEGFDKDWVYQDHSHYAYYTQLPPGNYTFKVKATNISGIWNDKPTELRIIITPPWWSSVIAKIIYFALFALGCYFVFQRIKRQNQKTLKQEIKTFENEKEKELYQAKINFFINIAHEIRTPLTLIKSPLEKVMTNQNIPPEALGYLQTIEKNTGRLLNLVNQLLDFRKTELDGYRLNFVKTDIVKLLEEICIRFEDTAEERKLSFETNYYIKKKDVFIDKEACTKIISNLLSNALKYAASQIIISIDYLEDSSSISLEVSNDGDNIPQEIRQQIFEPFFRGEYSVHKTGTGLGLPLARSLAEMHRGSLELADNALLTTFRLCLPINQPDSIKLSEDTIEENSDVVTYYQNKYEQDPNRPTILIVEDNEEMMNFIGQEANASYNILTATNGKEALLILKDYSVQLIISDVMMPVMDGFTLLKTIKTNLDYSHIPIILLTAKNTVQARLEGIESGADAYIEKPFSMTLLLAQTANLLTNREKIRHSYSQSPIAHLKSMAYTKADEHFLERLNDIINENMSDMNLDVDMIADLMHLSRPTLYRKISALSDLTPNELIRIARLKKAAGLMNDGELKIYEISEIVGFNSQSYFSRSFTKQFGMSPSEYARQKTK